MTSHDHPALCLRAEAHSGGELICLVRHGNVPQQQLCRLQNTGGVGVVPLAIGDEPGGGAVDGLEHSILTASVGAARRAYAALNLGGLVGDDVAVQIGQNEHLKPAADFRVHQIGGHDVDVPVLGGDFIKMVKWIN